MTLGIGPRPTATIPAIPSTSSKHPASNRSIAAPLPNSNPAPPNAETPKTNPPKPLLAPNFDNLNILTTVFWVGEKSDSDNGFIPNAASAWDDQWQQHYGGVDDPSRRKGYVPAQFTPQENSFYFALPYNDLDQNGKRKASAASCQTYAVTSNQPYSWCKNIWITIRSNNKIAYAQWEDVGPFEEDDTSYVFGSASPRNKQGVKAGLDVSPATKDYLGLGDVSRADWGFVRPENVPDGPWKTTVTTSKGYSVE